MYIQIGKLSILQSAVEGLTFEDCQLSHPSIRKDLLFLAWKEANPKGKLKAEKKSKED